MTGRLKAAAGAVALLCGVLAAPVTAQETRAAALERQRAEKAQKLQPYKPAKLEKALLYVERVDPLTRISPRNGLFVDYGYTAKPIGAGVGLSAGFRHDILNRRARVELEAGMSIKNYQLLRADLSMPYLFGERFEIGLEGSYRHNPQEDFYGLGPGSLKDDRVSYLYDGRELQARAVVKPTRWLRFGTRAGILNPSIGRGTDKNYPSLEDRFSVADAPGLAAQPDHAYGDVFAAVDTRDQPGNARAGGYYEVALRRYRDREADRFGFRRVDLDLQQFFPIFDKKRVIAARFRVMSTAAPDGEEVPFYFQPTLGGSDTLRSYGDHRFRDRNVMFLNAEYRWEAFSGLDMALFSDWGKVARRTRDLRFSALQHAYGIGFRFNTYKSVFLRADIATGGDDGIRFFLKFSKAF